MEQKGEQEKFEEVVNETVFSEESPVEPVNRPSSSSSSSKSTVSWPCLSQESKEMIKRNEYALPGLSLEDARAIENLLDKPFTPPIAVKKQKYTMISEKVPRSSGSDLKANEIERCVDYLKGNNNRFGSSLSRPNWRQGLKRRANKTILPSKGDSFCGQEFARVGTSDEIEITPFSESLELQELVTQNIVEVGGVFENQMSLERQLLDSSPMEVNDRYDYFNQSLDVFGYNNNNICICIEDLPTTKSLHYIFVTKNEQSESMLFCKPMCPVPVSIRWRCIQNPGVKYVRIFSEGYSLDGRTFPVERCRNHIGEDKTPEKHLFTRAEGFQSIEAGKSLEIIRQVFDDGGISQIETSIMFACNSSCSSTKLPVRVVFALDSDQGVEMCRTSIDRLKVCANPKRDVQVYQEKTRRKTEKQSTSQPFAMPFGAKMNSFNVFDRTTNATPNQRRKRQYPEVSPDENQPTSSRKYPVSNKATNMLLGEMHKPELVHPPDETMELEIGDETNWKRQRFSPENLYAFMISGEEDALQMFKCASDLARRKRYDLTKKGAVKNHPLCNQSPIGMHSSITEWLETMEMTEYRELFIAKGVKTIGDLAEALKPPPFFENLGISPEHTNIMTQTYWNFYADTMFTILSNRKK